MRKEYKDRWDAPLREQYREVEAPVVDAPVEEDSPESTAPQKATLKVLEVLRDTHLKHAAYYEQRMVEAAAHE